MDRKDFIKNSLFATGAILLPNAIWAFEENFNVGEVNSNKFVAVPNFKRFKLSGDGIKFFETELSIFKSDSLIKLHRKYFISESTVGFCTPVLLETSSKEHYVFIPELYEEKKHNGFIIKICENGLCEETKVFTHENQGYFAFWGKAYLGRPALYHYNFETFYLMRMHFENEQWINQRVMPMYPREVVALYGKQLQQVSQGQLHGQFGYDFKIHKDGFYQLLELKAGWEEAKITCEKEAYEKENPARIYINHHAPSFNVLATKGKDGSLGYTNPFVPVYCTGDDLSHATIKPDVIYQEVAGSKIEIPDMPAYKTQDDIGDCKAFSLAVLLQHHTCQKWKSDIPDCKNPPADSAISYFGLMAYTNRTRYNGENLEALKAKGYTVEELNEKGIYNTFQPRQEKGRGLDDVINELSNSGNQLILESCRPFENLTKRFSSNGLAGLAKRDEFFGYLKTIFEKLKNKNESNIPDCTAEVSKLNAYVELGFNQQTLKKALTKDNFDQFLYTLFFSECKKEVFPPGFSAAAFPLDSMNVTPDEVKRQIIKGLKLGKPVLFPALCVSQNQGDECGEGHSLVISGFKRVKNNAVTKDVFKLHNSWGAEWQMKNNDGWVDADVICQNTIKVKTNDGSYRIGSASVIWLDP